MRNSIAIGFLMIICSNVQASGIPVVDIAKITQDMTHYISQIADFGEQVAQGVTQTNQYTQMLTEYQQVLKEYAHYLDQLQGIRKYISDEDWLALMNMSMPEWGSAVNSIIPSLDVDDPNFRKNLDLVMDVYNSKPQTVGDFSTYLTGLGIKDGTLGGSYGRMEQRYDSYLGTLEAVARNEELSNNMRNLIVKNTKQLSKLGDQSDLATMQMMATQNNMMMQQMERQATIANMQLMKLEQEEGRRAADSLETMKRYYDSIKRQQDQDWSTSNYDMTGF